MIDCTDCTKQIGSKSEPIFVEELTQATVCRACYKDRTETEPDETEAQFENRSYGETRPEQLKHVLLSLHDNLRSHLEDDLYDEGYTEEEVDDILLDVQNKLKEVANTASSPLDQAISLIEEHDKNDGNSSSLDEALNLLYALREKQK